VGLIEGEEFSMPVVSTWIGKRSVDGRLRQKLLTPQATGNGKPGHLIGGKNG
jgi:hypothetical protein